MHNYNDYKNLIRKKSWSWHRTTGIELETLIAKANVAFAECSNNYNPDRGKFSTLLYHAIESHFKNLIKSKQNKYRNTEDELQEANLFSRETQEKNCIFKDTLGSLSKEAREVTSIVLEAPADLLAMLPKPMLSRHQLTKYLRLKGWKFPTITKAFAEIRENLNF